MTRNRRNFHKRLTAKMAASQEADITACMKEIVEEAVMSGAWSELADIAISCFPEEDLEEMFDLQNDSPSTGDSMEKKPPEPPTTTGVVIKTVPELLNCYKHGAVSETCSTCDCIHGAV